MSDTEIKEIQRILSTRLDTLGHILDIAEKHLPDINAGLQERIAPDMLPLGSQIAFTCNQARGFAQWSAGKPVENYPREVGSIEQARSMISETQSLVSTINADDSKLGEMKRTGLGPGLYCETSARQYVNDYIMPNLYFHITVAYAILRQLGAPIGKQDYMRFLAPHVKKDS